MSDQPEINQEDQMPQPEAETAESLPRERRARRAARTPGERRLFPRFWTFASVFSLLMNVILIGVVAVLAANLFAIKNNIVQPLLDGLYSNFQLMDEAHIRTTIPVSADVPAKFDLPLDTDTSVVLTEDTVIPNATVSVYTGGLIIQNAQTDIILPKGSVLPIHLTMTVPVDQQIPVDLTVEVDIPLNQTELHEPFVGLQGVVAPYKIMVEKLPSSWADLFKR